MPSSLDCRGLSCPQPALETKKMLTEQQPQELSVLVDNEASHENVCRFLTKNGYTVTSSCSNGVWTITATSDGKAITQLEDADYVACPTQNTTAKTLVLVTTETLGRGDDTLGTALMGNFFATLPELGSQLWRIVLLNGGVKLAVKEGKALDSLKKLADAGVSILVCGTCLGHYGLLEKKQVGETTNMLDIVTSLSLADKIIRP